jgi:DNA-binding MarR family transcriptional regulator/GNAT superfamily N-acetyltransferase
MPAVSRTVADIRRFTRHWTRHLGIVRSRLYGTDLSLAEARALFELGQAESLAQGVLRERLGLDKGQLSRLVAKLARCGLVARRPAGRGRSVMLALTEAGSALYREIDARSAEEVGALVATLTGAERADLAAALETVTRLLPGGDAPAPVTIRPHGIGDIGWIIHRHGVLYAREYGWTIDFERAVAEIGAAFLRDFDAATDRCLVAERNGRIVGSATVVRQDAAMAKLRLVYVEPELRGTGLGRRLVEASMDAARAAGFRSMTLWTNDVLLPARALYERLGFRLTAREPHRSFGADLVGETWEREL